MFGTMFLLDILCLHLSFLQRSIEIIVVLQPIIEFYFFFENLEYINGYFQGNKPCHSKLVDTPMNVNSKLLPD